MKKSTYILVLALLSSNFLDIRPFGDWLSMSNGLWGLVALYLWVAGGFLKFNRFGYPYLYTSKNIAPSFWILAGVFLSMIPALYFYGQPLLTSLVAYRVQYFWVTIPLLLYIRPTEEDLIKSLTIFSILFFLSALLRTYVSSNWFYYSESFAQYAERHPEDVMCSAGYQLVLVPFYYYCGKVREYFSLKNAIIVILFLAFFLIIQNRSVLFVAALIAMLSILKGGGIFRFFFVAIILGVLLYQTKDIWSALLEETTAQVNDTDYARFRSIQFFLNESKGNLTKTIFGNGLLSAHVSSRNMELSEMGVYNSDVGLLGYWNLYGIIPVIVIVNYLVKAVFSKRIPFSIRALGLHILLCSLTISYFGSYASILWFALFYYLFVYYRDQNSPIYGVAVDN